MHSSVKMNAHICDKAHTHTCDKGHYLLPKSLEIKTFLLKLGTCRDGQRKKYTNKARMKTQDNHPTIETLWNRETRRLLYNCCTTQLKTTNVEQSS